MNPGLLDAIKAHFARKSSAILQEIAQAANSDRWSPEAIAAAQHVLRERTAGRAGEPVVPEPDPPAPPTPPDAYSMGFLGLSLLGAMSGLGITPVYRVDYDAPDPDVPIPFGPGMAWLALDTTDTGAVASALRLEQVMPVTWAEGIRAARESSIFVTPPLAHWTLAVGTPLFPPDRPDDFLRPLLERLSQQFGEAQYFATHGAVDLHIWAQARRGRLLRGYGWLGSKGLTLWNEGRPTREEQDLGIRVSAADSPVLEQAEDPDATPPDAAAVLQLASLWSLDPTTLDGHYKEPTTGLRGTASWVHDFVSA
jgi:hypothetical protein